MRLDVVHGDSLEVLAELEPESVSAVVTDPPYALSFMGKSWDVYDGREDAGFAYWLAGFIDGEGCFSIKPHARGTFAPSFRIKVRADDRGVLEGIRRTLDIGVIAAASGSGGSEDQVTWTVGDRAGCQRLVDLLDKYPLRAKKRNDYLHWREAVCEWTDRPRGNRWAGPADQTRMESLRRNLMEGRRYTEVPWSGHEFQDWCRLWAQECLRVLRPGGCLLAFGGTRTYHRLTCGLEDAGFEIRDTLAWLFGSGFPKSLDVSKAIDKRRDWAALALLQGHVKSARERLGISQSEAARRCGLIGPEESLGGGGFMWFETGMRVPTREQWPRLKAALDLGDDFDGAFEAAEREQLGEYAHDWMPGGFGAHRFSAVDRAITAPMSENGQRWQGWGTALKPAHEPIVLARKPLAGTVAANVLEHGTGALNIDGCRIAGAEGDGNWAGRTAARGYDGGWDSEAKPNTEQNTAGRWPANVVMDEAAAALLDEQAGVAEPRASGPRRIVKVASGADRLGNTSSALGAESRPAGADVGLDRGDGGGASRFLYVAKADTAERQAGLAVPSLFTPPDAPTRNDHPTVKPVDVMRWLVRLVTPPGGLVLDPFTGSGTTGIACALEGFDFLGVEKDPESVAVARARIAHWSNGAVGHDR